MKVEEAWAILQDSSEEDPQWQKAARVLHHFVYHGEEFELARRVLNRSDRSIEGTFYDALLQVLFVALDELKAPYEGPKGLDAANDVEAASEDKPNTQSAPGLYGSYMYPVTREKIAGRLGARAKWQQYEWRTGGSTQEKKNEALFSSASKDEDRKGLSAQREASVRYSSHLDFLSSLKGRQHAMRADVVMTYEVQGNHYIDDLKSPQGKVTQQRTIDSAKRMLKGDRSLLAEEADYQAVLVLHGAELEDEKSVAKIHQRISRARTKFLRWSRDVSSVVTLNVYSDDYENLTLTVSQFLEGVYAWLKSQRTFHKP